MFGQYAILEGKKHYFTKEPDWWWEFSVVTSLDEVSYAQWQDENLKRVEVDGKELVLHPMGFIAAWRELALAFGGTNIPKDGEEDPSPVLEVGASIEEVETFLKVMPGDMVAELWKALKVVYPFWGPRLVQEEEENSEEIDPSPKSSESSKTE